MDTSVSAPLTSGGPSASVAPRAAAERSPVRSLPAPGGGRGRRIGARVLAIVVLYVLWELTARVTRNPTFIPAPSAVWHQLVQTSTVRGYSGHLLIEHLGVSLRRILIGSVIGVAAGLVLGIVLGTVDQAAP